MIEAFEGEKKNGSSPFCPNPIKLMKEPALSKRSRNNPQEKGKSKTRRLDMSKFALLKAKRLSKPWTPLPTTKSTSTLTTNATTRTTRPKIDTTTNPMMTSTCRTCKRWGPPCLFCVLSAPHPSLVEANWSDEDWDRDKQR